MGPARVLGRVRGRDLRARLRLLPPVERPVRGSAIGIDQWALETAQAIHAPWLDVLASIVGLLGQAEVTGGIALGIAIARYRRAPRDAIVPLFILLTVVIESMLKILIPHAPPPLDRARTVELLPFLHVPFANSFPSGHVARAAYLLRIGHGVPPWVVAAGIVLMAVTRVYLAEHWLSDVIGGALLGLAVAEIARGLPQRLFSTRSRSLR